MVRGCRKQKEKPGRIRGMGGKTKTSGWDHLEKEVSVGYLVEKDPGPRRLLFALMLNVFSSMSLWCELRTVMEDSHILLKFPLLGRLAGSLSRSRCDFDLRVVSLNSIVGCSDYLKINKSLKKNSSLL